MDRQTILDLIKSNLASGAITQDDLRAMLDGASAPRMSATSAAAMPAMVPVQAGEGTHMNVSKMLYYIGGLIVLIGIGVFVSQFWADIPSGTRILIALGGAIISYIIGLVLSKMDEKSEIATAFHLLGGVLFPFAGITFLTELQIDSSWGTYAVLFGALTLLYVATMAIETYPLITFFAIANGTTAIFSLAQFLLQGQMIDDFYYYFGVVMGASYLFMGTQFIGTKNDQITRALFFIGSVWVLGGAFMLYDTFPLWELVYPLLIAGMMALSINVKRMSVLLVSTFSIMSYVAYITGKYFADSVGWPLSLIAIGLLFIATGYFSFYLHGKYFKQGSF